VRRASLATKSYVRAFRSGSKTPDILAVVAAHGLRDQPEQSSALSSYTSTLIRMYVLYIQAVAHADMVLQTHAPLAQPLTVPVVAAQAVLHVTRDTKVMYL
jgi:hypothetical protein